MVRRPGRLLVKKWGSSCTLGAELAGQHDLDVWPLRGRGHVGGGGSTEQDRHIEEQPHWLAFVEPQLTQGDSPASP
jgi:hypothetical protein